MADSDDLTPWLKNFTPRAKHVLALAQKESERLNHDYVGTEHLLLGLIRSRRFRAPFHGTRPQHSAF